MDELKSKQGEWKGMADEHQKAIKELLTPEQMEKWKDMMPQMGKLRQFDSRKREFVTPTEMYFAIEAEISFRATA